MLNLITYTTFLIVYKKQFTIMKSGAAFLNINISQGHNDGEDKIYKLDKQKQNTQILNKFYNGPDAACYVTHGKNRHRFNKMLTQFVSHKSCEIGMFP